MKKSLLFIFFINYSLFSFVQNSYTPLSWTWLYKKQFKPQDLKNREEIVLTKLDIPDFTQVVFSWNATRPKKGFFSFYAQVRNSKTKKWFDWHKMMIWGKDLQKSFLDKRKDGSSYFYVRLEIPENIKADGFKIKVQAHGGAELKLLRSLFSNVSDFTKFRPEKIDKKMFDLSSVYIEEVPKQSQKVLDHPNNDSLCSPTSCSMLIGFLNKEMVDPVNFAANVYDKGLDCFGSWPFNTAHAYELNKGKNLFLTVRLNSWLQLYYYLNKGIPVIVSVRGNLKGGAKEYDKGHLLLVVGFDKESKSIICHDPAFDSDENVIKKYKLEDFIRAWEKSRRLTYLVESGS